MIRVTVNGREQVLERPLTVAEYVQSLPVNRRWVAVARNGEVVPRDHWPGGRVRAGDVLEVVRMVGGGAAGGGIMAVRPQARPGGGERA